MTAPTATDRLVAGLAGTVGGRPDDPAARPMLMLHGAGGSGRHWTPFIAGLPADVAPITLDLPGHGRSPGTVPESVDAAAEQVATALGELTGGRPAAVVAHSLGGLVAVRLALLRPDLVSHLALVATAADLRLHPQLLGQLAAAEPDAAFFGAAFTPGTAADRVEVVLDDLRRVRLGPAGSVLGVPVDLSGQLARLRPPTLVVVARGDPVISPRKSRALAAAVPGARLAVLEGGHYLQLERPDEVRSLVLELIGPVPRGARPGDTDEEGFC